MEHIIFANKSRSGKKYIKNVIDKYNDIFDNYIDIACTHLFINFKGVLYQLGYNLNLKIIPISL